MFGYSEVIMKKTVVELFAGVGGFHLGLKNAGDWQVLWANQWEPGKKVQHAFNCYQSHFPETEALNMDISVVNDEPTQYPIPKHNLLVGGFPCQDYSVASTGAKGIEGKKGVLWWEIRRILERHRPPFVLLENVDRLLKSPSKQRGRDFAVMLACFRDLGYNVEWRVINAADYGFSQRRRRVFIFGYHESTNYHQRQTENIDLFSLNDYVVEKGFFSKEFPIKLIKEQQQIDLYEDVKTISDTHKGAFFEAGIMIGNQVVTQKYEADYTEPVKLGEVLVSNVEEKYYLGDNLEIWKTMKGAKKLQRKTKEGFEYTFSEGAIAFPDPLDRPARTMLTSESSKNRSTHVVEDPETKRLRVLTPVEAERLNGFGDEWTNTGMPEKFRYFCMGNALVVGLVTKMGKTLNSIFELEKESAEEMADRIIHEARLEEMKIIKNAEEKADAIIANAKLERNRIIDNAEKLAENILKDAKEAAEIIINTAKDEIEVK
jgi:DNA (cytosine-5)-methyltransferase 1